MSEERYIIPNLRNACRVLARLSSSSDGLSAKQISEELEIPRTTAFRILKTLSAEAFIDERAGRYRPGAGMLALGMKSLSASALRDAARETVAELAETTGETAHVLVPFQASAVILEVRDSPHPLRVASRPGDFADLHCSAGGKAMLAFDDRPEIAAYLERPRLAKRTGKTITDVDELKKEIGRVKKQGYSLDDGEYHEGVRCIGAPVFGADLRFAASIGITGVASRIAIKRVPSLAKEVIAAASRMQERLSGRPMV